MDQIRTYFPVGLGVQLPDHDPRKQELSHPIDSRKTYSLHTRPLGEYEHSRLGDGAALVPHYRDNPAFPFRNSSSIPDLSYYAGRYERESRARGSALREWDPEAGSMRTSMRDSMRESAGAAAGSHSASDLRLQGPPAGRFSGRLSGRLSDRYSAADSFDFSPYEHSQMGMDPHQSMVSSSHNPSGSPAEPPSAVPSLSPDASSISEMSDAVLSPLPHPLGSKLNLWHHINNSTRAAEESGTAPALPSALPPGHYVPPASADDSIATMKMNYTRKQGLRYPSLLKTPHTVRTTDWEAAFDSNVAWERGRHDPQDGLLLPGLPQLPTFPQKALIVDNVPCDVWGRRMCSDKTAAVLVSSAVLFPPLWLLIGAGYCDGLVGVVPRRAKLVSFGLGGGTLVVVVVVVLAVCLA